MITFGQLGKLGRFCNGAFQICSTIGMATKSGQPFAFNLWRNTDAKERFGSVEDIEIHQHLVHPLPLIPEGMQFVEKQYTFGYHEIYLPTGNYSLWGHFQSDRYFLHCIDLVRYYMTFKDEPHQQDFTAIHVRLGDYQEEKDGQSVYHPRLTMDYYRKAMELIPGPYLVFSDDVPAAAAMFKGMDNVWIRPNGDYLSDFKVMKRCKHFIIGNSSYSLLASILADQEGKKTVAPLNWFGSSWHNPVGMAKDIYPVGSIVL
jgi:hypothetical protein